MPLDAWEITSLLTLCPVAIAVAAAAESVIVELSDRVCDAAPCSRARRPVFRRCREVVAAGFDLVEAHAVADHEMTFVAADACVAARHRASIIIAERTDVRAVVPIFFTWQRHERPADAHRQAVTKLVHIPCQSGRNACFSSIPAALRPPPTAP